MRREISPVINTQILEFAAIETIKGYVPTRCIDCLQQEKTLTTAVAARKVSYANGNCSLTGVCERHRTVVASHQ